MRFMILGKATKESEAGAPPTPEAIAAMQQYNEELVKAGILLAAEGLAPTSKGARVRFSGDKVTVIDGPFAETKEVLGGYWMIQVRSKAEAIEWASRCPASDDEVIEVRQVQELSDFPPDVQKAASKLTEMPGRRA